MLARANVCERDLILVPRATRLFLITSLVALVTAKTIFFDWPIQTVCAIT